MEQKLILVLLIVLLIPVVSGIRINEAELNPEGSDAGNEWIELYSDSEINLSGWKIISHDNKIKDLNQSFNGYLIINFNEQWLDNDNESVRLYNGDEMIYATPVLRDSFNDNRTWSYCNEKWVFLTVWQ